MINGHSTSPAHGTARLPCEAGPAIHGRARSPGGEGDGVRGSASLARAAQNPTDRVAGLLHERAVGGAGVGELGEGGGDERGLPTGIGGEPGFLPGGGAVLVVVAVAPLVEDQAAGGGEEQV